MKETKRRLDMYGRPRRLVLAMDIVLAVTASLAVASLILEYGFGDAGPIPQPILHGINISVVAVFLLDRAGRLLLAGLRWKEVFRATWPDYALIGAAGIALAVSTQFTGGILGIGAAYIIVTQAYIIFVLLLRWAGINQRAADSGVHPAKLFLLSFAVVCLVGSGLLMLPAATTVRPIDTGHYLDALFTSVSATCVTGLIVLDTGSDWTPFGQAIILCLIQLGGLGVMIFGTLLALMMGRSLGVRGSSALGEMVAAEGIGEVYRVIKFIVLVTFLLELIGALCLWPMYSSVTGPIVTVEGTTITGRIFTDGQAAWFSLFHSVSAFCNAGFSLHDANLLAGVQAGWDAPIRRHWQVLGVISPLIILGGLGFPVLEDIFSNIRRLMSKIARRGQRIVVGEQQAPRARFTLQSKIVLTATAALLLAGAAGFMLLSPATDTPAPGLYPDWRTMGFWTRLREAIFASVTARTAGFNTIDMNELSQAAKLWMCALMSIGGSPSGTAGGMKTVPFALLMVTVWSVLRRRDDIEVFKRSISHELLRKTITVAFLYMILVITTTLALSIALDWEGRFIDILFEACSACGTVGLSTGVTGQLNAAGKIIIIAAMFVGRLGPITMLVALTGRSRHVRYSYPNENLTIG
ncbi:MAG: TrkH family potassium uptake protein [Phycisphaerae bacterium]